MKLNWFRFYTDSLSNPKIQRLSGELFKSWVNLLCVARIHGGRLPPVEDLAFRLRLSEALTREILDKLTAAKLLDLIDGTYVPHDWDEFQYPSDGSGGERSKRYRQRRKIGEQNETSRETSRETFPSRSAERLGETVRQNRTEEEPHTSVLPVTRIKKTTTTTNGERKISKLAAAEFPKTAALLATKFPAIDSAMVSRIIQASCQAWCSVDNPKIPEPGDDVYAAAVEAAKNGKQTSAALFLRTVPTVISNWARSGRPVSPGAVDPLKISPYNPLKFKKGISQT